MLLWKEDGTDAPNLGTLVPETGVQYRKSGSGQVRGRQADYHGRYRYGRDQEKFKGVDIVFGGPPCLGFSVIGKMNPDDVRSQLIWSFLKVVDIIKPKAFVMENVKALAAINKWKDVREEYIARAEQLGYRCIPFIINAAEYGIPQKRERVFFIGIKGQETFEEEFVHMLEKNKRLAPTIRELFRNLGPAGTEKNPKTCNAKMTYAERPVMRRIPYDCLMFNGIGQPIDTDGYSRTITASQGGNMTDY